MKQPLIYSIQIFFLLFLGTNIFAQNIVPNPGFELYSNCPDAFSPFSDVTGWDSYRETPNYFNSCATAGSWGSVPSNSFGYQPSNGNAYVGVGSHGSQGADTVFREYIGRQLSTMLNIGQKYYVSFKVSLADKNSIYCATNNLGVVFSTIPYSSLNPAPIRNSAHVYTNTIITDTANWTTISGSVIADSVYNYIIIGNFFDNQHSSIMTLNSTTTTCFAYYFVDDICVSTDSITCMGTIGINEQQPLKQLSIFPNPANSNFTIQLPIQQTFTLSVTDITGRNVYTNKNATGNITVDANGFSSVVYFVKARNERTVLSGKLIKE